MTRDQLIAKLQELPENREIRFSRTLWESFNLRPSSAPYGCIVDDDDNAFWFESEPPEPDEDDEEWYNGLVKTYMIDLE